MKVTKKELLAIIENKVADGVANMTEIDIVAKDILKEIWPLIEYYEYKLEGYIDVEACNECKSTNVEETYYLMCRDCHNEIKVIQTTRTN